MKQLLMDLISVKIISMFIGSILLLYTEDEEIVKLVKEFVLSEERVMKMSKLFICCYAMNYQS